MKPIESSKQPTSNSQQPTQNGTQPISNLEQIGLNKFTANFTQKSLAADQKFLGARAPLGIAHVKKKKLTKKFQTAINLFSPASTCTLVQDSPK